METVGDRRSEASANSARLHVAYVAGRVPLLPFASALRIFERPDLVSAVREALTPDVRLAILFASGDLHREAVRLANGEPVERRAALRLLAYLVRMATRTTPFALFAGVGTVELGDVTSLTVDEGARVSRTRFDAEWLEGRAEPARRHAFRSGALRTSLAQTVRERGGRWFVSDGEHGHANERQAPSVTSVKITPPIRRVGERAQREVATAELFTVLESEFGATPEEARALVGTLLSSSILVDEGCVSPTGEPAASLLRIVEAHDSALWATLGIVHEELVRLDRCDPRTRSDAHYERLIAQLPSGDRFTRCPLQVDLHSPFTGTLNAAVLSDVRHYAELLMRSSRRESLDACKDRFRASFPGEHRLVPLLDFCDVVGDAVGHHEPKRSDGVNRLLAAIVADAVRTNKLEHELTEEQAGILFPPLPATATLPQSLEVGFSIAARSQLDLDDGNYRIGSTSFIASGATGAVVGRYLDVLDIDVESTRRQSAERVTAELVYRPVVTRLLNVAAHPLTAPYEIVVNAYNGQDDGKQIALSDVYVGIDARNDLYLWSKHLQRRVDIVEANSLNPVMCAPRVGAVLSRLADEGKLLPTGMSWGAFDTMPFTPRVRYGRIVLALARWRFFASDTAKPVSAKADLQRFLEQWSAPRYVNLVWGDNKLLIDTGTAIGLELLLDQVATKFDGPIVFEEAWPEASDVWLEPGGYRAEFIAGITIEGPARSDSPPAHPIPSRAFRIDPAWTYARIIMPRQQADTFIRTELASLVRKLGLRGEGWFFVRYADPQDHIRLRVRASNGGVEAALRAQLDRWVESKAAWGYSIEPYEPEVERYGGVDAMPIVERLFTLSSEAAMRVVGAKLKGEDRCAACAADLVRLLENLLSIADLRHYLDASRDRRHRKASPWQRRLIKALERETVDGNDDVRAVAEAGRALRELREAGNLTLGLENIVDSLVHMHVNRVGAEDLVEDEIRLVVHRALESRSIVRSVGHGRTNA